MAIYESFHDFKNQDSCLFNFNGLESSILSDTQQKMAVKKQNNKSAIRKSLTLKEGTAPISDMNENKLAPSTEIPSNTNNITSNLISSQELTNKCANKSDDKRMQKCDEILDRLTDQINENDEK